METIKNILPRTYADCLALPEGAPVEFIDGAFYDMSPAPSTPEKQESDSRNSSGVDAGLIAMFLKLTPEERLLANDNAIRAIMELRNAYQEATKDDSGSGRDNRGSDKGGD